MIDGFEPRLNDPGQGERIDRAAQIAKVVTTYPRQKARGLTDRSA